ncbi:MAG: hypothetical protein ACLQVD_17055 [Capsulimonadaceae bacterium]
MSQYVIEGTWEEIERHKAELIGRQLRLTIKGEKPGSPIRNAATHKPAGEPKKLVGYGAFKGMTGGSEAFAREKQAEIELEDRNL